MEKNNIKNINIGVLGCGHVGSAFVELVQRDTQSIENRTGIHFEIKNVAVRNVSERESVTIDTSLLTNNPFDVVANPQIDVVVELIGGIEPAKTLIEEALKNKKSVVTANKELLANVGSELAHLAQENGVDLLYEASVAGGIPIVRVFRESLVGEHINRVVGIVNGTTNYVLTRMAEDGCTFEVALAEAQSQGYAERDPSADVEGYDAAAKASIIARLAFGSSIVAGDVYVEGICKISPEDIAFAKKLHHTIKPVAIIEKNAKGAIGARVFPMMIHNSHPLASVRLSFNALFVEGDSVGDLMFYGRGAGGFPTASAVLGDLINVSHNKLNSSFERRAHIVNQNICIVDEQESPFYLTIDVIDKAGVLAHVTNVFCKNDISIRSMEQIYNETSPKLLFLTHKTSEFLMQKAIKELSALEDIVCIGSCIRVLEC